MKTMTMKTEPRDIVVLLGLLRDNLNLLFSGLCSLSDTLHDKKIITDEEGIMLLSYIDDHPTKYFETSLYYFLEGDVLVRAVWLDKQIKRLENKQLIK